MKIGEKIKSSREQLNLSQHKLAVMCGWENATRISNYENNYREPTLADIKLIAKALEISPSALAFEEMMTSNEMPAPKINLPVLDWSTALNWPHNKNEILANKKFHLLSNDIILSPNCYTLIINDDSMVSNFKTPVFHEGSSIVVDPDKQAKYGDFIVALINKNDLIFRKYIKYGDTEYLQSLNTNIPSHNILIDENIKIVGVVVAHLELLK